MISPQSALWRFSDSRDNDHTCLSTTDFILGSHEYEIKRSHQDQGTSRAGARERDRLLRMRARKQTKSLETIAEWRRKRDKEREREREIHTSIEKGEGRPKSIHTLAYRHGPKLGCFCFATYSTYFAQSRSSHSHQQPHLIRFLTLSLKLTPALTPVSSTIPHVPPRPHCRALCRPLRAVQQGPQSHPRPCKIFWRPEQVPCLGPNH